MHSKAQRPRRVCYGQEVFPSPWRDATVDIDNKSYCQKCESGQKAAAKAVDRHVEPKDCFVWHQGGDTWTAIPGTGCAHWVAHQLDITHGTRGNRCLKGKTFRVKDIARNRTEVSDIKKVQVDDIYVTPSKDHCGMVSAVTASSKGGAPTIEIQHDSSAQGGVSKNDFATYFHGKGKFFR